MGLAPRLPLPRCTAQAWGPCQSSAKRFFLLDSDVAFSAPRRPRFWPVFGVFGAAVPLRFPVLRGWLWGLVWGLPELRSRPGTIAEVKQSRAEPKAQPRPAQPRPAQACQAAVPLRFPVLRGWLWGLVLGLPEVRSRPGTGLPTLTPAQPTPQPKPSPGQPAQPSPGQPKPCQSSANRQSAAQSPA